MTALLDELLDTLAGPTPNPIDLAALHRRHCQRQRRRGAARGLAAGTAVVALVAGLAVLARPDGYAVDTVAPATSTGTSASTTVEPTRVVVNPVQEAAARLARPDPRIRFRVTARQPSYWRTAGIDDYDGTHWRVRYDADDALPGTGEAPAGTPVLRQTVRLEAAEGIWLPAAPGLIDAMTVDLPLDWDAESGTLLTDLFGPGQPARSYVVVSAVTAPTPDELRAAPPDGTDERYTALPEGAVTGAVAAEAERVTAGAATRYDQALALQNHLRTLPYRVGEIDVDAATIETAVVGNQGGASPQLATAFAVMARHLGIPTRIAVGYTWGERSGFDPARPTYQVSDRQTHVWPEVWFAGIGWVAFEPTPGRGMPGAEAYTGVTAQQDADDQPTLGS